MLDQPAGAAEWGLLGFSLMIIWKLLDVGKIVFLTKRAENGNGNKAVLSSASDILHHEMVKDIHDYTESVQHMIASGRFECQWKDRDEVRDLLETLRSLMTAIEKNTVQMEMLATQIRLMRHDG